MDIGVMDIIRGSSQELMSSCCYSYGPIRVKGNTMAYPTLALGGSAASSNGVMRRGPLWWAMALVPSRDSLPHALLPQQSQVPELQLRCKIMAGAEWSWNA